MLLEILSRQSNVKVKDDLKMCCSGDRVRVVKRKSMQTGCTKFTLGRQMPIKYFNPTYLVSNYGKEIREEWDVELRLLSTPPYRCISAKVSSSKGKRHFALHFAVVLRELFLMELQWSSLTAAQQGANGLRKLRVSDASAWWWLC